MSDASAEHPSAQPALETSHPEPPPSSGAMVKGRIKVADEVVEKVAAEVKANVARSVSRMLGMRVTEVNVTVDDVRLPGESRPRREEPDEEPSFAG